MGEVVGSYELLGRIGRGGMGEVWRARHRTLGRLAAVKRIRAGALSDDAEIVATLLKRFTREAQAMARLTSPHTVRVYDFGATDDGVFFYAMELLDGVDLRTLVERHGPLPPARAVHLLRQACESLEEAHRAGLVHRDVKPANLVVGRAGIRSDFLKVVDFGLVKSLAGVLDETQLTTAGAAAGSPAFMAPEVVLDEPFDGRADVYGLGAVAYWLLTGRLLFQERTAIRTLMAQVDREPAPPSAQAAEPIPQALDALVMRCLAKRPEDRPASMAELDAALAALPLDRPWTATDADAWWGAHGPTTDAEAAGSAPGPDAPLHAAPSPPTEALAATAPGAAPETTASGDPVTRTDPVTAPAVARHAPPERARALVVAAPLETRLADGGAPRGGDDGAMAPPLVDPLAPLAAASSAPPLDARASRVPRPPKAPLEAAREDAVQRLQTAFGEGDLTLSEYDERLELTQRARDALDLELATRDLPGAPAAPPKPEAPREAPASAPGRAVAAPAARPKPMLALFSGVERRGVWEVPERLQVVSIFGGVQLDLRKAALAGPRTVIECVAIFGGVEIAVPPDVRVEVDGVGVFGGFTQDRGDAPLPPEDAPVVVIQGFALFGGVAVSTREPERHPWKRLGPPRPPLPGPGRGKRGGRRSGRRGGRSC